MTDAEEAMSLGQSAAKARTTTIGPIESEVLAYLQGRGRVGVAELAAELKWPLPVVAVAVAVLVSEGLAEDDGGTTGQRIVGASAAEEARSRPRTPRIPEIWFG